MSTLKVKDNGVWLSVPTGGVGVPAGGTAGQFMTKSSSTDYATQWSTVTPATIGAMAEWDLLWENASPTSDFSGQSISVSYSTFDFVCVVYKMRKDSPFCLSVFCRTTDGGFVASKNTVTPANVYFQFRTATLGSNAITFADAIEASKSDAGATNNAVLIPISIYGIKGVNNS